MNVIVHLGEPFWRAAGQREVEVSLAPGACVADALTALINRYPALASDLSGREAHPAVFMGDEQAAPESPLAEGARLHIVWPVSGG